MSDSQPPKQDMEVHAELDVDAFRAVKQQLASLSRIGVETLPKGNGRFILSAAPSAPIAGESANRDEPGSPEASIKQHISQPTQVAENRGTRDLSQPTLVEDSGWGSSLGLSERQSQLQILEQEVSQCTRCKELVSNRTQTVFGVGNLTPRLVFVGEGPGADEDRTGEPFVGAAGKLLNKILEACHLQRDDVYILNTVKCRPPGNRNPSQTELDNCWGFAERQLDLLQPEFICCLGSVAAKRVLNTTQSLGRLRQKFHQYRDIRVLVTYHPAYLLRTESAKRHVWEDMKLLMKEMGVGQTK